LCEGEQEMKGKRILEGRDRDESRESRDVVGTK